MLVVSISVRQVHPPSFQRLLSYYNRQHFISTLKPVMRLYSCRVMTAVRKVYRKADHKLSPHRTVCTYGIVLGY